MKVAVVYWSGTGNTEAMAQALAGAIGEKGAEAELLTPGQFSADDVANYDVFALGCPSMGDEVLEESEFQPMYDAVEGALSGKTVALFGSYGWGDGQWMRDWEERAKAAGLNVIAVLIANESPDADAIDQLNALGAQLAG